MIYDVDDIKLKDNLDKQETVGVVDITFEDLLLNRDSLKKDIMPQAKISGK